MSKQEDTSIIDEDGFNPANQYIFLTPDLAARDDFTETRRFRFYMCDYTSDPANDKPPDGMVLANFLKKSDFSIITDKGIAFGQDVDADQNANTNIDSYNEIDEADLLDAATILGEDVKNGNHPVKFALFSIKENSRLLRDVIRNNIPFAFVCPEETKCEWIHSRNGNSFEKCISCKEIECHANHADTLPGIGKPCCTKHINYSEKSKSAWGASLQTYLRDLNSFKISKFAPQVPVFEWSTAIDLLRWSQFLIQTKQAAQLRTAREEAQTKLLIDGLGIELKTNG